MELGRVQRVDGIDPATVEDALPPVDHLPSDLGRQRHVADVPVTKQIGVKQFDVVPRHIAGLIGKMIVVRIGLAGTPHRVGQVVVVVALVHDLGVVVAGATDEHPVVLVVQRQVGSNLVDLGNQPGVEVAIAIIGVDVAGVVTPLHAPQRAVGQGSVERALDLSVHQTEFDRLHMAGDQQWQHSQQSSCLQRSAEQGGQTHLLRHFQLLAKIGAP